MEFKLLKVHVSIEEGSSDRPDWLINYAKRLTEASPKSEVYLSAEPSLNVISLHSAMNLKDYLSRLEQKVAPPEDEEESLKPVTVNWKPRHHAISEDGTVWTPGGSALRTGDALTYVVTYTHGGRTTEGHVSILFGAAL